MADPFNFDYGPQRHEFYQSRMESVKKENARLKGGKTSAQNTNDDLTLKLQNLTEELPQIENLIEENVALNIEVAVLTPTNEGLLSAVTKCQDRKRSLSEQNGRLKFGTQNIIGDSTKLQILVANAESDKENTTEMHKRVLDAEETRYSKKLKYINEALERAREENQGKLATDEAEVTRLKEQIDKLRKEKKERTMGIAHEESAESTMKKHDEEYELLGEKKKLSETLGMQTNKPNEHETGDEGESGVRVLGEDKQVDKPKQHETSNEEESGVLTRGGGGGGGGGGLGEHAEEIIKVQKEHGSEIELLRKELEEVKEQVATVKSRLVFKGE